jgi:hypothetical protein
MVRKLVAFVFIAFWMALGWTLKLDPNQYLLLGAPLTVIFQLFVHRRPLRAMWVRSAPRLQSAWKWAFLAVALAALPAYDLCQVRFSLGWAVVGWHICAILGAPAVAYAIQNYDLQTAAGSIRISGAMVVYVIAIALIYVVIRKGWEAITLSAAISAIRWSFLYIPIHFVLEEVTFRGALDTYVHPSQDKQGMLSAVTLSLLWGLWHLPIAPVDGAWMLFILRLASHILIGTALSMSWRIGGNLLTPAVAHAILDGVRNALAR